MYEGMRGSAHWGRVMYEGMRGSAHSEESSILQWNVCYVLCTLPLHDGVIIT